ncbi:MAG: hisB [Oscillospiraceae bacterium]|jgi:imidazoleglycerol-phosphate dehydratase|nr:hisB [Oscillospiraceae bacterium]
MRTAEISRTTKETDINIRLNLDGNGMTDIKTGVGFFDHMLTALAVHAGFDLTVHVMGDLEVDCHHTIEDTGIVLGQVFLKAIGDKIGINRYGSAFIPMDESLGFCCLDISARPFLVFDALFESYKIGDYETQMTEEFFRAFAFNGGITLHAKIEYGSNDHHKCEALYKALAHALKQAIKVNSDTLLSTKGVL